MLYRAFWMKMATPAELLKVKIFGRKSLKEVREKLEELGLQLKQGNKFRPR
jgi:DNA-directed RNA polymerase alpha subunit